MAATVHLSSYKEALILLGTAGVIVPLIHRFRVSPVLGFLGAGAILGPHLLGALAQKVPQLAWLTVSDSAEIAWMAELGVVFLLFIIGLELSPQRLRTMRRLVFGLGLAQVIVTGAVLALVVGWSMQLQASAAVLVGLALALSSTAIVVELLSEQDRLMSSTGRATFSVLLLQDLAVVPILFLAGVLTIDTGVSIFTGLGMALGKSILVLALIIVVGMYLLRPFFHYVGQTESPELFMAATMFVIVGTSVATAAAGLSMALGAFVAGLLLAETEYRRAIEATIKPFKGLLLGVFFFSVGMSIDFATLIGNPTTIIMATLGLVAIKAVLFLPMARQFGLSWPTAVETAALLGPGGEFAFIVIGLAAAGKLIAAPTASLLLVVVSLSMVVLPLAAWCGRRAAEVLRGRTSMPAEALAASQQPAAGEAGHTIVVGFGRVGQLVCDMLAVHGRSHFATDFDVRTVTRARAEGKRVYWGDATAASFLTSCGIARAEAIVITIHTQKDIDVIVETAHKLRPGIPIVARAKDAGHAHHLYALGVTEAVPETIEASLQLSEAALTCIGVPAGPVIASIHEKRDEIRALLMRPDGSATRALRQPRADNKVG